MSTANFVFAPPATPALPVVGTAARFPVHRIFCVGRNYHAHALEMGNPVDKATMKPFYFTKSPSALVDSGATVPYPCGTANYHYEMELVVAIGAHGFRLAEADAPRMIFGYAAGLDMTRRDLQLVAREQGRPWDLGKDFELVAGGGIGGLAAALALVRQGFSVKVLEQSPQIGEIGAGIQLGPNAFPPSTRWASARRRAPGGVHRLHGHARRARRVRSRSHPHRRGLPPALRQPLCGDPPRRRAQLAAGRRTGDRAGRAS
jgi:hypothetical protein